MLSAPKMTVRWQIIYVTQGATIDKVEHCAQMGTLTQPSLVRRVRRMWQQALARAPAEIRLIFVLVAMLSGKSVVACCAAFPAGPFPPLVFVHQLDAPCTPAAWPLAIDL